ncbi:hypothetical protein AVEN_155401-1 [Araneus ventricosus]|uniref:Uncharacterized protein n=1 Tax=Araneus ventricosus TaxID=182803 RepID=A0A4Y2W0D7_ARAVE|nr:hypothetical protein AVEN_155401-1 [Araneus ventricosus]
MIPCRSNSTTGPFPPSLHSRSANTVNGMSRRSRTGTRARGISLFFVDEFQVFDMANTKSVFQAFQKVVKNPPSADKIEPPSEAVLLQRGPTLPTFFTPSSGPCFYKGVQPLFYSPSSDVILSNLVLFGMSIK